MCLSGGQPPWPGKSGVADTGSRAGVEKRWTFDFSDSVGLSVRQKIGSRPNPAAALVGRRTSPLQTRGSTASDQLQARSFPFLTSLNPLRRQQFSVRIPQHCPIVVIKTYKTRKSQRNSQGHPPFVERSRPVTLLFSSRLRLVNMRCDCLFRDRDGASESKECVGGLKPVKEKISVLWLQNPHAQKP